ncbi:MAG TPA: glycosyltransferase [Chitinophagaceae bacterium]|nr:glycosyltransferase [Chitinophagaceae bacterium]
MKESYPYDILHLDLRKKMHDLPDLKKDKAYYLVFWWNSIPLGELYLTPGESKEDLSRKILHSIRPSLHQYISDKNIVEDLNDLAQLSKHFPVDEKILINSITTKDVSVIICTRNRAEQLKICLSSLMELASKPSEMIVVDNAPIDDSTKIVVGGFPSVKYVIEERRGLDIARNTGIRTANHSIVAYVDDDVKVHPQWISEVSASFDRDDIAAMTGLVLPASLNNEAQLIFEKHWPFNRGYVERIFGDNYFKMTLRAGPPTWEIGAGANMAFRRNIFEKIGYFDERLDVGAAGCNGDSELWFRILKNNFSIRYNPRAVVYHEHRTEMKALKKQLFNYMKGFTAAALIQQRQEKKSGYRRRIFGSLPKFYLGLIFKGFPNYSFRHRTIFSEMSGMIAGLGYYLRNRNKKSF